MTSLLDYTDYKAYLFEALEKSPKGRGSRSQFAQAVETQPSYVTRILNESAHLSLEQAERANHFFGHTEEQSQYFVLLVELGRAGTPGLKSLFEKQVQAHQRQHLNLKKQFQSQGKLSEKEKNVFYSSWQYSAILAALTVPALQTKEALSQHFRLPAQRVAEVLAFLESTGQIRLERGKPAQIHAWNHLAGDLALVARDHTNWRHQAIRSLESQSDNDLHYSSVVTLSESDVVRVKKLFLKALDDAREIIRPSKEEKVCSLLLDFFEI